MCGIYGVVDSDALPDRALFDEMDRLTFHRGPDDGGLAVMASAALGARRLAVLDLSAAGHQPMRTPDGRFVLAYNGEVYNFRELRSELEQDGERFASNCDTEVVLRLLSSRGPHAVGRLAGMFAFALWDAREGKLSFARDPFGIKPLYYYQRGSRFVFASELKVILALPGIDRTIDAEALGLYLTLGFVPGVRTLFASIRKAAPGTLYTLERGGALRAETYYWLRDDGREEATRDPLRELEDRLRRVVKRQLVSDVPVGVFLSGGLDSSALVVAMRELLGQRARTFTIAFGDPQYSEAAHARVIAELCGTDHRELVVSPDAAQLLPRIVWHLEEPLADSSILPLWFLCELARHDVTVALSGDGGDETLGGYTRYLWAPVAQAYGLLPALLRESLLPRLAHVLPRGERRGILNVTRRVRKFFETGRLDRIPRYLSWFALLSQEERARLVPGAKGEALDTFADLFRAAATNDPLRQLQYVDIHSMLAHNLLLKSDKLSMAHSLEVRVPYLDPELAEFAYRLPWRQKVRGRTTKPLLRRFLAQHVPREIARRRKQGFEVPLGAWFRGDLEGHARELLLGGALRAAGLLDEGAATALMHRHQSRTEDLGTQIFGLLVLETFFRTFEPRGLA